MDTPMMKCGHAANATTKRDGKDIPSCVICSPKPEATIIDDAPDSLEGRMAKCAYRDCKSAQPSSSNLAFFEHKKDKPTDEYYCGCRGWD